MSEYAKTVFEQFWLHARHQELQRLTFTSVYSAIVAGAFAFLGSEISDLQSRVYLSIGMTILSILGFFLMHAWRIPFIVYSRLAEIVMIKKWEMEHYKRFGEYDKLVNASLVFHLFYVLLASLFFSIFLLTFPEAYPGVHILNLSLDRTYVSMVGFFVVFLALCLVYTKVFRPVEDKVKGMLRKKFKSN